MIRGSERVGHNTAAPRRSVATGPGFLATRPLPIWRCAPLLAQFGRPCRGSVVCDPGGTRRSGEGARAALGSQCRRCCLRRPRPSRLRRLEPTGGLCPYGSRSLSPRPSDGENAPTALVSISILKPPAIPLRVTEGVGNSAVHEKHGVRRYRPSVSRVLARSTLRVLHALRPRWRAVIGLRARAASPGVGALPRRDSEQENHEP